MQFRIYIFKYISNYFIQFKAPLFHSKYSPSRIIEIIVSEENKNKEFNVLLIKGRGKTKIISMSKIKKIIEILKNRKEKGTRVKIFGSNPHSKGEVFSLSEKVILEIDSANNIKIILIIIIIMNCFIILFF